jgi:hypothetical protein
MHSGLCGRHGATGCRVSKCRRKPMKNGLCRNHTTIFEDYDEQGNQILLTPKTPKTPKTTTTPRKPTTTKTAKNIRAL